jgi:MYXO-CTERM domain-containing protein
MTDLASGNVSYAFAGWTAGGVALFAIIVIILLLSRRRRRS